MAKANWLTISPMSGIGNATIRNIGSEHTGRLDRTTTVTGKAVGIASEKTYSVVQHAKSEFVAVNDASYQVAGKGGTVTVTGTSNSPILTVTVDNGGTIGTLTVKDATVTNGQAIPGDPGAAEQYSWKVQIQVAENPTASQRSLTVKVQGSSASVADEIEVVQAASSFTYEYVPSASVATIAASGGNSVISAQLKTYRNGSLVSTQTVTPTLTGSGTGFSILGNTVTAASRGTTVGGVRSITVTCNYVTSETGETLSDTVEISQAANSRVIVYGKPTITSFEVADIPASGGSVSSGDVEYSQSRHYYYDSGQTEELSALTTGGSLSWGNAVTAPSRGTTIGNREIVGTLTVTVSMNGQTSVEQDVSVYQAGNYVTAVDLTGFAISYSKSVSAAGGTVSPSVTQGSVKFTFTSGSESTSTPSSTYGTLSQLFDYFSSGTDGFSAASSSDGNMTARYRGTTVGGARSSGEVLARKIVTWTPSAAYNEGADVVKASTTAKDYALQEANVKTAGDIFYGEWQVSVYATEYISASSPCPASGDSFTIYSSASRTRVQEYNYTSGATDTETLGNETATPELSVSGEGGLTLSDNTATYANRGTTEGNLRSNTIVAIYEGASDTEQVYQEANVKTAGSISYGTWQVSVSANRYTTASSPCPASGGTCTITASASRTRIQNYSYTSGATDTETLSTESGTPTLSISGTGASLSGTTVTWVTRGTEYSTTTRSATVTATMGTVTAQEVVYQAKNEYTEEWDNPVVDMQPSSHTISSIGNDWYVDSFSATQSGTRTYDSGSTQSVTNSEFTWSSSENVDWLSSQVEFNEDFCITSDDNEGSSSRSGVVTLTATGKGGKTGSDTITITQDAGAYLNVSPTSLSFAADGGTKSITIDTNESWAIS